MKNCPTIDQLIELADPDTTDVETATHVRGCVRCTAELRLLREIPTAMRVEVPVDDDVLQRTLEAVDGIAAPDPAPFPTPAIYSSAAWSGALGMGTASLLVLTGGSTGASASLLQVAVFSILCGLAVWAVDTRLERRVAMSRA